MNPSSQFLPHAAHPAASAIAIFARSVVPGRVKTRLIPLLGPRGAADFQSALIIDTVRKVDTLGKRASRFFFLAGRLFPPSLRGFRLRRQRGADLGERLERAFRVIHRRHRIAVVIGTDSPLLRPQIFRQALRELRFSDAVLGPSPDGGYYLIGLRRRGRQELRGMFRGIRWGSSFAFRDTLRRFLRRGLVCSVLEPCPDVDRPLDFRRLVRDLARSPAARRGAAAVWQFIRRQTRSSAATRRKIRQRSGK